MDQRAIEAQIAAAATGRKPLYFDPWGDEELSDRFAEAYRHILPDNVEVHSRKGMVLIYRLEVVLPILDSDPAFYRRRGESVLDSIARVSAEAMNGELLGFGARHLLVRPAHAVSIIKGDDLILYYFVSDPDPAHAARFARMRADDFDLAFGWDDVRITIDRIG